jgi:hypothetical protein
LLLIQPLRDVRDDDPDVGIILGGPDSKQRRLLAVDLDRLFPEDHGHLVSEAAHQVLRPLENEIPPQVRKAQQGWAIRTRRRILRFILNWHSDAIQHFASHSAALKPVIVQRAGAGRGSVTSVNPNEFLACCSAT